jgi:hypothetical protein
MVLQRICGSGAGGWEQDMIALALLQHLWGLNWTFYNSAASARQKSKQIFAPSVTLLGVSVPEQFYGAVSLKQITGGLLNRHHPGHA